MNSESQTRRERVLTMMQGPVTILPSAELLPIMVCSGQTEGARLLGRLHHGLGWGSCDNLADKASGGKHVCLTISLPNSVFRLSDLL